MDLYIKIAEAILIVLTLEDNMSHIIYLNKMF